MNGNTKHAYAIYMCGTVEKDVDYTHEILKGIGTLGIILLFDLTKAFSSALRAFCNSTAAKMNSYVKLVRLCFKFGFAIRANISL